MSQGSIRASRRAVSRAAVLTLENLECRRLFSGGSLVGSFGSGGIASATVDGDSEFTSSAIVESNGELINVGTADASDDTQVVALASFSPSGNVDNVTTAALTGNQVASAAAVAPDGSIYVALEFDASGPEIGPDGAQIGVAHFNSDGSLDTTFGGGAGFVFLSPTDADTHTPVAIGVSPDGDTIYVGARDETNAGPVNFELIGISSTAPTGEATVTFDTSTAFVDPETAQDSAENDITGLAVQPDGKILLSGDTFFSDSEELAVARFNPGGTLDSTFGIGGMATTNAPGDVLSGGAVALDTAGNIYVAGYDQVFADADGNTGEEAVAKFSPIGVQDPAFGIAHAPINEGQGLASFVAIDSTDEVVLSAGDGNGNINVARLNPDGTLDTGFAGGGGVATIAGNPNLDLSGMLIQPTDGTIVLGGDANDQQLVAAELDGTSDVVVSNPQPPVASIVGPGPLTPGFSGTFTIGATDPDSTDQAGTFTYDINWGDGTPDQIVTGSASITASHVFTTDANDTVSVTATDQDGRTSAAATAAVAVVAPATVTETLVADPLNPGQSVLIVEGTSGNDTIELDNTNTKKSQTVSVVANGGAPVVFNTFVTPISRIQVFANNGDDSVTHGGGFKHAVDLFGGDGNDTLKAGSSGDILVGGAGDDSLASGAGNDVEIGGIGADKVVGDAGEDLLISGTTSYDNDPTSLEAISAEWTSSTGTLDQRIADLTNGGGLNGNVVLVADQTVFDDDMKDTLSGGAGADWMFYNTTDGKGFADKDNSVDTVDGDVATDI